MSFLGKCPHLIRQFALIHMYYMRIVIIRCNDICSTTVSRQRWLQTATIPTVYSSIAVGFLQHCELPLATQPLVISSSAIQSLSSPSLMRLTVATVPAANGIRCYIQYTTMVREGEREREIFNGSLKTQT